PCTEATLACFDATEVKLKCGAQICPNRRQLAVKTRNATVTVAPWANQQSVGARTSRTLEPERKLRVGPTLAEVLRIYRDQAGLLLSTAALVFLPLTLLTEIVSRDSVASGMAVSLVFSG